MKRVMFLTLMFAVAATAWSMRYSASAGQDDFIPAATHEKICCWWGLKYLVL